MEQGSIPKDSSGVSASICSEEDNLAKGSLWLSPAFTGTRRQETLGHLQHLLPELRPKGFLAEVPYIPVQA